MAGPRLAPASAAQLSRRHPRGAVRLRRPRARRSRALPDVARPRDDDGRAGRPALMRIGVNLLNFGPGVSPDALAGWTQLAETLGYHFVMISDHVAMTPDVVARYPAPFYDPFVTLAWLARATKRVELGTTVVILPYRHPLHTARPAANVDRLSGGRFIFGVGVGWAKQEFAALGVPFERRGAMSNDYLAAIKTAWTTDPASYSGPFVSFRDVHTGPRPVRS